MPLSSEPVSSLILSGSVTICSSSDVEQSVKSLHQLGVSGSDLNVLACPPGWFQRLRLYWHYLGRGTAVVITHECCWPLLDVVLAIRRPLTHRVEVANLSRMSKLSLRQIIRSGSISADLRRGRMRSVRRVLGRLAMSPLFEIYAAPGSGKPWAAWVARPLLKRSRRSTPLVGYGSGAIEPPARNPFDHDPARSTMVILTGLGTQDPEFLLSTYLQAVDEALSLGFGIVVKDHIRPTARINLHDQREIREEQGVELADPSIPAEALIRWVRADVVVGIDSAALGLVQCRSISLLNLVPMSEESREALHSYLQGLPRGRDIAFVDSFEEFEELLLHLLSGS